MIWSTSFLPFIRDCAFASEAALNLNCRNRRSALVGLEKSVYVLSYQRLLDRLLFNDREQALVVRREEGGLRQDLSNTGVGVNDDGGEWNRGPFPIVFVNEVFGSL